MFVVEKTIILADFASCRNNSVFAYNPSDYTSLALGIAYNTKEFNKTSIKKIKSIFVEVFSKFCTLY